MAFAKGTGGGGSGPFFPFGLFISFSLLAPPGAAGPARVLFRPSPRPGVLRSLGIVPPPVARTLLCSRRRCALCGSAVRWARCLVRPLFLWLRAGCFAPCVLICPPLPCASKVRCSAATLWLRFLWLATAVDLGLVLRAPSWLLSLRRAPVAPMAAL